MITQQQLNVLIPLACEWAKEQEQTILRRGVALIDTQIADAKKIGVRNPEKVKLLSVSPIPIPDNPLLQKANEEMKLITPQTEGLTIGYGIFIRSDCWGKRSIIVHELAHIMQYKQKGSIDSFLSEYLWQCSKYGYHHAPFEQEAKKWERTICGMGTLPMH